MKMVLDATDDYDSMAEVEENTELAISEWLTTFRGWGLLSSMLPTEKHRYFILSLVYASTHWNETTGGPYSTEKIFDTVKYVYENCPGKEIRHLVPRLGVWFEEVVDDDMSLTTSERKKSFTIFLRAKWMLEIKFVFEKKRVNTSLKDFAAEAVAQQMKIEDDIDSLEIPLTLLDNVYDKFKDEEWIRSHRIFKMEIESNESESDEEFMEAIEEADEALEEADEALEEADQVEDEVAENGKSTADNKETNDENVCDHELLVVEGQRDSNAEITTIDCSNTVEDRFELVTVWGVVYFFLMIFAFLCV